MKWKLLSINFKVLSFLVLSHSSFFFLNQNFSYRFTFHSLWWICRSQCMQERNERVKNQNRYSLRFPASSQSRVNLFSIIFSLHVLTFCHWDSICQKVSLMCSHVMVKTSSVYECMHCWSMIYDLFLTDSWLLFFFCFIFCSYQLEALDKSIRENTIVYLETGSGKTLIAIMLLRSYAHHLRKASPFIAVFLVPQVVLVSQVCHSLSYDSFCKDEIHYWIVLCWLRIYVMDQ